MAVRQDELISLCDEVDLATRPDARRTVPGRRRRGLRQPLRALLRPAPPLLPPTPARPPRGRGRGAGGVRPGLEGAASIRRRAALLPLAHRDRGQHLHRHAAPAVAQHPDGRDGADRAAFGGRRRRRRPPKSSSWPASTASSSTVRSAGSRPATATCSPCGRARGGHTSRSPTTKASRSARSRPCCGAPARHSNASTRSSATRRARWRASSSGRPPSSVAASSARRTGFERAATGRRGRRPAQRRGRRRRHRCRGRGRLHHTARARTPPDRTSGRGPVPRSPSLPCCVGHAAPGGRGAVPHNNRADAPRRPGGRRLGSAPRPVDGTSSGAGCASPKSARGSLLGGTGSHDRRARRRGGRSAARPARPAGPSCIRRRRRLGRGRRRDERGLGSGRRRRQCGRWRGGQRRCPRRRARRGPDAQRRVAGDRPGQRRSRRLLGIGWQHEPGERYQQHGTGSSGTLGGLTTKVGSAAGGLLGG